MDFLIELFGNSDHWKRAIRGEDDKSSLRFVVHRALHPARDSRCEKVFLVMEKSVKFAFPCSLLEECFLNEGNCEVIRRCCLPFYVASLLPALALACVVASVENSSLLCYKGCLHVQARFRTVQDVPASSLNTSETYLYRTLSSRFRVLLEETSRTSEADEESEQARFRFVVQPPTQESVVSIQNVVIPPLKIRSGGLFIRPSRQRIIEDIQVENGNFGMLDPMMHTLRNIRVNGALAIVGAHRLERIEDCQVTGRLSIRDCMALKSLDRVSVGTDIDVSEAGIEIFPEHIVHVSGDLTLMDCSELIMLGANLRIVRGSLNLSNCYSLVDLVPWANGQSANQRLVVFGNLNLEGCISLRELPPQLSVMGSEIHLEGCSGVTHLPEPLLNAFGNRFVSIYISGSGISSATVRAVTTQHPNVHFYSTTVGSSGREVHFHHSEIAPETIDDNDDDQQVEAVQHDGTYKVVVEEPFTSLTQVAKYFGAASLPLAKCVEVAYKESVLSFMNRVRKSREFALYRQDVVSRVQEILERICADSHARRGLLVYMGDSAESCEDKPVWALNQMTLVCELEHARGNLTKMRSLGLGVMRLGVVHEHARTFLRSNEEDLDEVGVFLQLEVQLQKTLGLPVSTKALTYPVQLPQDLIDDILDEAEALQDDSPEFESWLSEWPEWRRELRSTFFQTWPYSKLNVPVREMDIEGETNLRGEALEDPVLFNGYLCSYWELMTRWVETEMDFFNVTWRDADLFLSKLEKVVPGGKGSESCEKVRLRSEDFDGKRTSWRNSLPTFRKSSSKRQSVASSQSLTVPQPEDMIR